MPSSHTQTPSTSPDGPIGAEEARFLAVAGTGDASAFALLTEQYRRELHVHCYRMLASYEDAQDMVQETFTRAWAKRGQFAARASLRAWLYRIATNACLDFLARRRERVLPEDDMTGEVRWLQPYPDHLLPPREDEPESAAVDRETIELAFVVAVQHLPARQRAVLVLRDVLGWSARQAAETLELSVPAANSALQRARETMRRHLPSQRSDWATPARGALDEVERSVVDAYMRAHTDNDVQGLAQLLADDVRFAMPPESGLYVGRDVVVGSWVEGGFGTGEHTDWRCLPTRVNRQPAVMVYLRRPGQDAYHAFAVDVLRVDEGGEVTEVLAFAAEQVDLAYGLPVTLPA